MMITNRLLLLTAVFINLIFVAAARAEIHQYSIQKKNLTELGFPISFPQLYFFNGERDLFYITGGGRGDAIGDLQTFASGLDKKKIARMSQRPPVADHALWNDRFKALSKQLLPARQSLFYDHARVTLVGLILDLQDYPRCTPCKALIKEMQALAEKEGLSLTLISRKRQ
ncbi:MAG TPA: hypothetical protein EYP34_14055 [Chromatiaceae bacterium]|nr:hypothetical protein [Chromatiaceae bacterium]